MIPAKFPKNDKEAHAIIGQIRRNHNEDIKKYQKFIGLTSQQDLINYNNEIRSNMGEALSAIKARISDLKGEDNNGKKQ